MRDDQTTGDKDAQGASSTYQFVTAITPPFHSKLTDGHTLCYLYVVDEGALILLSLLCSSIRNTAFPSSKMHALDLLLSMGRHVADDIKLDRLVPYVVSCLNDDVGLVRAHALRTLAKLVRTESTTRKTLACRLDLLLTVKHPLF